jgi:Tfp pilus assembly protein PilO
MMLRQPVAPKTAIVVILVAVYALVLVMLIVSSRRETMLAAQVRTAEQTLAQAMGNKGNDAASLRSTLAAAKDRLAILEARVPREMQDDLFERVAQDAQRSGISDFRYQRKSESPETLQAGTYKVYHFSISGRGSRETLVAFLDGLQKDSGQTMLIDNVSLTAAGKDWQMNADIIVYTTGG